MFRVRPKWNPENAEDWNSTADFPRQTLIRTFFCNATSDPQEWSNGSIQIGTMGGGYGSELEFVVRESQPNQPPEGNSFWKSCDISYWNKGEWHHCAFTWDAKVGTRIYIDGTYWRWDVYKFYGDFTWNPMPWDVIRIGCHMYGWGGGWGLASADIDELYIYDRMLSEEEIVDYYRGIMPVDISAEETVISNTKPESFVNLKIINKTDRTVTGEFKWSFNGVSGTELVTLSRNEKRIVPVLIHTPAEYGRHYLNCLWKGDTSFSKIIRLLVIDGDPRPSQDILELSPPIETILCLQDYPNDRYCDTGGIEVVNSTIGQYRQTGTGKYSAFSYNFHIEKINKPHLLIVEYPDDAERTMEIILNTPKYRQAYDIQIGIFTGGDDYPPTNQFNKQKIIFWPRDENYSISIRNLWEGHRAAARKITLYAIEGSESSDWLPANKIDLPKEEPERLLGLWWEDARIGETFGGKGMLIERGNPVDEFYRNLKNIMDYIHYTGYNLIVYPIYMYTGPHYPSDEEEYLSHFRRLYHPDNWVELILRMCEINNIYFIPSISILDMNSLNEISTKNSEINQVDKFGRIVKEAGVYPMFNPLHPVVQEKILALVDEILNKYGHFSSFKGISFYFWANTILWFGSLDCSYDDYTWSLFLSENQMRSFAKAYLSLPARSFNEIDHPYKDIFQVRELLTVDKHYFYVVNKKSNMAGIKLTFSEEICITDIVGESIRCGIKEYTIYLDVYELRSYFFTPPQVQISEIAIVPALLYSKELGPGWELLSIPIQMSNNSLEHVLQSIFDSFQSVWHYDSASRRWKKYIKGTSPGFNDLDTIELRKGYRINMTKTDTLEITGSKIANTATPLNVGWNLVGYPSLVEELINEVLLSISQQYIAVWTYDDGKWYKHIKGASIGFNDLEKRILDKCVQ